MPSVSIPEVELFCVSDPGREPTKQLNEDSGRATRTRLGHLALVCDGMGGHAHGQAASQAAVDTIIERLSHPPFDRAPGPALVQAIQHANHVVYQQGAGPAMEGRPGTTCVAVLVHAGGAEIAHVGDSRVYLIRSGQIYRMTRDHSVVQQLVDAGMLSAEQAGEHPDANRITRALGMAPTVDVELYPGPFAVAAGDVFVLATDGLTDLVPDLEISSVVNNRLGEGLAAACQALVDLANLRGGHDNITVLLLRIVRAEPPPAPIGPVALPGARPQASAATKTLVDEDSSPTQIDPPRTLLTGEALQSSPTHDLPGPPLPAGTHPDASASLPSHTAPIPTRDTEPGLEPSPFHTASAPGGHFLSEYPSRVAKLSTNGKILLVLAAVFTLFIVGSIVLWWVVRAVSDAPPTPSSLLPTRTPPFESGPRT
ncbi:MAG TPA: protein phosphatase 2C domain-containing protein [Polyangiaceae bacterium]|nr:protein phosphatase 2C domain-containing protein [Polyangiaceae bacterium]